MLDQDGNRVPSDLVLLPDPQYLGDDDIIRVLRATWYQVNYAPNHFCLAASFDEMGGLSDDDGLDEIITPRTSVQRVDAVLRRYSEEDGFYHA